MCSPAAKDMAAALDEADDGEMPPPPPVAKTATSDYTIGEFGLAPPPPPTRAALGADVSTTLEALQTLVRVEEGMPPVSAGGLQSQFLQGDDLESVTRATTRELPEGWRSVPSASRKGEVSYVHAATGFKQSRFPTGPPSDSAGREIQSSLEGKVEETQGHGAFAEKRADGELAELPQEAGGEAVTVRRGVEAPGCLRLDNSKTAENDRRPGRPKRGPCHGLGAQGLPAGERATEPGLRGPRVRRGARLARARSSCRSRVAA